MGDNLEPRREFIETHVLAVEKSRPKRGFCLDAQLLSNETLLLSRLGQ